MKQLLIFFLTICLSHMAKSQTIPKVIAGTIERIDAFESKFIDERRIDIWLPENYSKSKKYAVLYMQDGQMLFDPSTTWNKQAWEVDATATQLNKEKKIQEFIVVGIWNGGPVRHASYFPQKPYEDLTKIEKESVTKNLQEKGRTKDAFVPNSDNYLKYIVQELKPYIDNKYSVYKNSEHTFIAGSSMGGLISIYAICEYPTIFGGSISMSTHWPGTFESENNPIPTAFFKYLKNNLPNPKNHKIYFDCGDQTLDAMYPNLQKKVDSLMIEKGFTDKNWITKYFPGDDHSEKSWNRRLNIPLEFLLKH
ncbi:MAG: alpha/beta hydrolase [Flavobacterium sp.]|nr:alpha/beta hydrolase [Flavobacterium sp.]